jgi:hydroxymethylbilane synthase
MSLKQPLNIGTRGSRLALAQASLARAALMVAHGFTESDIAAQAIMTTGDRMPDRPLVEESGKGVFTKEIEDALLTGAIDVAVHSAKDMPAKIPRGLTLAACLVREDARDCLIGKKLKDLPRGARLGTSSPRRAALMKRLRPDLNIIDFRGNVETRIAKIVRGDADATLLALAGLRRIGMESAAAEILELETFIPAIGQGAIVLEVRKDDERTRALLDAINHVPTFTALLAERAFLKVLDGSCRTPIAGHAIVTGEISFHGMILKPDGTQIFEVRMKGGINEAEKLGRTAGLELKAQAPADFFEVK